MVLKTGCVWAYPILERKMRKVSEETRQEHDEIKTGIFPFLKNYFF